MIFAFWFAAGSPEMSSSAIETHERVLAAVTELGYRPTTAPAPTSARRAVAVAFDIIGLTLSEPDGLIHAASDATLPFVIVNPVDTRHRSGEATVRAVVRDADGRVVEERDVDVTGSPTLYPLLDGEPPITGTVEVEAPAGMAAYSCTFG